MPSRVVQHCCYTKHLTKRSRLEGKSSPTMEGSPVSDEKGRGNSATDRERVRDPTWTVLLLHLGHVNFWPLACVQFERTK